MSGDSLDERSAKLFEAHRAGERFEPFTGDVVLASVDDAYTVQEGLVRRLCEATGETIGGWKIGLTSPRMQALLEIDSPIAGAVLAGRIHRSGHVVKRADYGRLGLECEVAVRLGRDLAPADAPFDFLTVSNAVEAVCAAIEVVDDRHADFAITDIGSLVADNSWNAGLVLGEFVLDWPDLPGIVGVQYQDGTAIDRGSGADVLGHPFAPLEWLANHLARRGQGLRAGDIVSTGSITPTRFPERAETCRFEVAGIGSVALVIE